MVIGAGLMLGPILGGLLTGIGWRSVFWFNVPIGIVAVLLAVFVLHEQARPAGGDRST